MNSEIEKFLFEKDLLYFLACAQSESFLEASEKLAIQQSGLSKIIQRLEQRLGFHLFTRSSRGIALTEAGKAYYTALNRTRDFWSIEYSDQMKKPGEYAGKLSVGFHPAVANSDFFKILPCLIKNHPKLELETFLLPSTEVTRKVAQLEIDIGIVINTVRNADIIRKELELELIFEFSSVGNPEPVLLYNPQMFHGAQILQAFESHKLVPVTDYEVIANTISRLPFSGLLPEPVGLRHQLNARGPQLLKVMKSIIWHRDRFNAKPKRQVLDQVIAALKA